MAQGRIDGWKNPADMHEPPALVEPGRYTSDDLDRIAVAFHPFEGRVEIVRHDPPALISDGEPVGVIVRADDGAELLTGTDNLYATEAEAEAERDRLAR